MEDIFITLKVNDVEKTLTFKHQDLKDTLVILDVKQTIGNLIGGITTQILIDKELQQLMQENKT